MDRYYLARRRRHRLGYGDVVMTERNLKYVTYAHAPGYRDLDLRLVDEAGREYRLVLPPKDVQSLIFACAEVAGQIGTLPPIDWDAYPTTITWPTITPWKALPMPARVKS